MEILYEGINIQIVWVRYFRDACGKHYRSRRLTASNNVDNVQHQGDGRCPWLAQPDCIYSA